MYCKSTGPMRAQLLRDSSGWGLHVKNLCDDIDMLLNEIKRLQEQERLLLAAIADAWEKERADREPDRIDSVESARQALSGLLWSIEMERATVTNCERDIKRLKEHDEVVLETCNLCGATRQAPSTAY